MDTSSSTRDAFERIQAAYLEMPGLLLTVEQVRRLCGVEAKTCAVALDLLIAARFLSMNSNGAFARLTEGAIHDSRPSRAGSASNAAARTSNG